MRIGGDGTGQSLGRYRFVNNTFITPFGNNVFRLFDKVDSVEMHNNVILGTGPTPPRILRMDPSEMSWVAGEQIAGSNNWVVSGATLTPAKWMGTTTGTSASLVDITANDLRPAAGSPLIDKGATAISGLAGHVFPSPLAADDSRSFTRRPASSLLRAQRRRVRASRRSISAPTSSEVVRRPMAASRATAAPSATRPRTPR